MGRKNKFSGMVYSTDPDYEFQDEFENDETLENQLQELRIHLDRKNRGGKIVTLVKNFVGNNEDLNALCKKLKSACGVGGSTKDGEIIIQGENREKVMKVLSKEGYKVKAVGG